jgi:hypothetical protein
LKHIEAFVKNIFIKVRNTGTGVVAGVETDILVSSMSSNVHEQFGAYTFNSLEFIGLNNFSVGWQH